MISVLMSVFSRERPEYLHASLHSLLEQTRPADELVLVWDGELPTNLENVIESFRDQIKIRNVKLKQNLGLGAALRAGLDSCRYDLVARLDADDIACPSRFERQHAAFVASPALSILSGYAIEMDAQGNCGRLRTVPSSHDEIIDTLWANPIIHPAVMFRRDQILAVGSYDAKLRRRQDYELWFRCAAAGLQFSNLTEPMIQYRFTAETLQRQPRSSIWHQGVIGFQGSRAIGLPLWKQLACFAPYARSLLPRRLQHRAYRIMQKFDPRTGQNSRL